MSEISPSVIKRFWLSVTNVDISDRRLTYISTKSIWYWLRIANSVKYYYCFCPLILVLIPSKSLRVRKLDVQAGTITIEADAVIEDFPNA